MEELSQLDLVFVVDLTGSMSGFLRAAQQQMVSILDSLKSLEKADLRVAISGYRDHSPHLDTTEVYPFTANLGQVQESLQLLRAYSPPDNQDAAEAVLAGLLESLSQPWRESSFKAVILVGDAPPHAVGATAEPFPDRWSQQDPTGYTLERMARELKERGILLYALSMSPSVIPVHDPVLLESFGRLAELTEGLHRDARNPQAAMQLFEELSRQVFGTLDRDRRVWEHFFKNPLPQQPSMDAPAMRAAASKLGLSMKEVSQSMSSLTLRKLDLPKPPEKPEAR